jgi:hypothetical protein
MLWRDKKGVTVTFFLTTLNLGVNYKLFTAVIFESLQLVEFVAVNNCAGLSNIIISNIALPKLSFNLLVVRLLLVCLLVGQATVLKQRK